MAYTTKREQALMLNWPTSRISWAPPGPLPRNACPAQAAGPLQTNACPATAAAALADERPALLTAAATRAEASRRSSVWSAGSVTSPRSRGQSELRSALSDADRLQAELGKPRISFADVSAEFASCRGESTAAAAAHRSAPTSPEDRAAALAANLAEGSRARRSAEACSTARACDILLAQSPGPKPQDRIRELAVHRCGFCRSA